MFTVYGLLRLCYVVVLVLLLFFVATRLSAGLPVRGRRRALRMDVCRIVGYCEEVAGKTVIITWLRNNMSAYSVGHHFTSFSVVQQIITQLLAKRRYFLRVSCIRNAL